MALGYDQEPNVVNLGDSAEMEATLYDADDKPVPAADLASVTFRIQRPDATLATVTGTVGIDGTGIGVYNTTDVEGQYVTVATFTTSAGLTKSVRADFEVKDPFNAANPSPSFIVAAEAWTKIEDCFDGEDEGPWLREMTLNVFNKEKMESFIDDALFDMNEVNPPTHLGIVDFVQTDANTGVSIATVDLPLLSQGVFIVVLRHLMRSYVEQPNPTGVQVGWQDRRDYLQRWESIYQIEFAQYERMLKLYKRRFLGLGQTRGLVSAKAGRLIPAPMRTRFVGRGYW